MIAARANWLIVTPWASAAAVTCSNASSVKERLICLLGMIPPETRLLVNRTRKTTSSSTSNLGKFPGV